MRRIERASISCRRSRTRIAGGMSTPEAIGEVPGRANARRGRKRSRIGRGGERREGRRIRLDGERFAVARDERRADVAAAKVRPLQRARQPLRIRRHAAHAQLVQRRSTSRSMATSRDSPYAMILPSSESYSGETVSPVSKPASTRTPVVGRRPPQQLELAGAGHEALRRILRAEAHLDRRGRGFGSPPASSGKRSPEATRSCHSTRSRPVMASVTGMLHLQARVHLHEIELAAAQQELDGARADVAHFTRDRARGGVQAFCERPHRCPAPALLR